MKLSERMLARAERMRKRGHRAYAMFLRRDADEVAQLEEENAALKGEIEELRERNHQGTYCAYCGEEFPLDKDHTWLRVGIHIWECEKHPLNTLCEILDEKLKDLDFDAQERLTAPKNQLDPNAFGLRWTATTPALRPTWNSALSSTTFSLHSASRTSRTHTKPHTTLPTTDKEITMNAKQAKAIVDSLHHASRCLVATRDGMTHISRKMALRHLENGAAFRCNGQTYGDLVIEPVSK